MSRLWPVLAVAAAAVVIAVILFGGSESREGDLDEGTSYLDEEQRNPELMTAEGVSARRAADAEAARREAEAKARATADATRARLYAGRVTDAASGHAVAGARIWAEEAATTCPRLPGTHRVQVTRDGQTELLLVPDEAAVSPTSAASGADGRFDWQVAGVPAGPYDVFVSAPGFVTACLCRQAVGSELDVRLQKALQLAVSVVDRLGRPVEGAQVEVKPGPRTPAVPGHAGWGRTDAEGRVTIDGLAPGGVMLHADHPAWMPADDGPLDPQQQKELKLVLQPALRVGFTLRSDDASEIRNPTLQWSTDGVPPHEDLLLLTGAATGTAGTPEAELKTRPVRIPCDHRNVQLEVKADGFAPWRPAPEPVPPEGGEKEMVVVLTRDTSLASLVVRFETPDGQPVAFQELKAVPDIVRLDPKDPGPVVVESTDVLRFPALPAGPYRVGARMPAYAPAEQEVQVVAGQENEATVRLRPAAKLRVRFTASRRLVVRFRLRREGTILAAFPLKEGADGAPATGLEPLVADAEEGALFGGLPAGAATIEVTNPELVATTHTVQLHEGDTTEVEIEVQER